MRQARGGSGSVRRAGRGAALLVAIAAVIAACSTPGSGSTNAPATGAPATSAPGTPTAAVLTLEVRTDASLGAVVVGKDGLSLYVFAKDVTPGKSACEGDCVANWPPLTAAGASGVTAGTGVTGAVGTITRSDGTLQVTLGGAPLYYFAGDSAAGQTNGQDLGDVWYLASPAGTPVEGTDDEATEVPAESTCSGPACY